MSIKKFKVAVTTMVDVEINDEKVTEKFMSEFRRYFFPLDDLSEHAEHLAQLQARELIAFDKFVEGYGNLDELGIKVSTDFVDTDFADNP